MKKMKKLLIVLFIMLMAVSGCTEKDIQEIPRVSQLSIVDRLIYFVQGCTFVMLSGGSMQNTIMAGDSLVVDKRAYISKQPERFDVVTFALSSGYLSDTMYAKRIIGLPGETLEIKEGLVYINNSSECLSEPYVEEKFARSDYGPYMIPDGHYFLIGDNRDQSYDSRNWEKTFLPFESIRGKVILISTE